MNVLLVEPNYNNKYPPMGLMKLSTYHKSRGDKVHFYKGIMSKECFIRGEFDRVYITTLFTFYYSLTIKTISEYEMLIDPLKIYVGGIMATLMETRLKKDIDIHTTILTGLLTDTAPIGFSDKVNVDTLPLDYAILDDIPFKYAAGDNYFAYISRGCTNKCKFCAVPILEPEFCITNNIVKQITTIRELYGEKQDLLLLDNNILSFDVEALRKIVDDIRSLGFDKTTKYYPELPLYAYWRKLENPKISLNAFRLVEEELVSYLKSKTSIKKSKIYQEKYLRLIEPLDRVDNRYDFIKKNFEIFSEILRFYHRPVGRRRCVDFNQGIDARQLTSEKMEVLSMLPLEPFRLAFDGIAYKDIYVKAVQIAVKSGVKSFSNYLLYNYDDKPDDLWHRLQINIDLAKKHKIKIFSFPMKFAPIDRTDRKYIGKHWNSHYLSNIYAILNVTKGIVADGESFFYKAFGCDINEFFEILTMPRDFVTYRKYFEESGLTQKWKDRYDSLSEDEINELIDVLCNNHEPQSESVVGIMPYYSIRRKGNNGGQNNG